MKDKENEKDKAAKRNRVIVGMIAGGAAVALGVVSIIAYRMRNKCMEHVPSPFVEAVVEDDCTSTKASSEDVPACDAPVQLNKPETLPSNFKVSPYKNLTDRTRSMLQQIGIPKVPGKLTHDHPDNAIMRCACEALAYQVASREAAERGCGVADIGGNYARHHRYNRTIHCCTPVIHTYPGDVEREKARQELLTRGHRCDTVSRCFNPFDADRACPVAQDSVLMLIDVCYYIPRELIYAHAMKHPVIMYGHKHSGKNPLPNSTHEIVDGVVTVKMEGNNFPYTHPVFDWGFPDLPSGLEVVNLVPSYFYEGPDADHYLVMLRARHAEPVANGDAPRSVWADGYKHVRAGDVVVRVPQSVLDIAARIDGDPTTSAWGSRLELLLTRQERRFEEGLSYIKSPEFRLAAREVAIYNYKMVAKDDRVSYMTHGLLSAGGQVRDAWARVRGSWIRGPCTAFLAAATCLGWDDAGELAQRGAIRMVEGSPLGVLYLGMACLVTVASFAAE